jgi:hypothetical protein
MYDETHDPIPRRCTVACTSIAGLWMADCAAQYIRYHQTKHRHDAAATQKHSAVEPEQHAQSYEANLPESNRASHTPHKI